MNITLTRERAKAVEALAEYFGHSVSEVADFALALGLEYLERVPALKDAIQGPRLYSEMCYIGRSHDQER